MLVADFTVCCAVRYGPPAVCGLNFVAMAQG
jgi:hypothetical protein